MTGRTRQKSPAAIAKQHVAEWFETLMSTADLGEQMEPFANDAVFTEVQEAVTRRFRKDHPSGDQDDDNVALVELSAREAGYLIGVQVGLRLRGVR